MKNAFVIGFRRIFSMHHAERLAALCLLLFTIGIGNVWGEKLEITHGNSTTGWTIKDRGWNSNYWGLCQTTTYCITSPTIDDLSTITSIEVYARTYGTTSGNSNKIGVYTGSTQIGSSQTATSSFSTYTFTPSSLTGSGTIRIQSQGTANSAGLRVTRVTINYTPAAASHTLSSAVSPVGGGSVSLSAESVAEGSTATATAKPATYYTFTSWSISGTGASLSSTTTNPTTVTMGTANATVTATFTAVPKASVTLSEAGATTTDETTYYVGDTYTLPTTTSASCGTKVLVGWSTVTVAETNTKPSSNFYEKGANVTLAASQTFYAVFATASGGGAPTAYTAGDEGNFVIASKVGETWYALPTNPTVNSGKITGAEITVNTSGGVDYVTSTNATGYTWTIANATYGQTISDGSKYIYHSNGGASGTNLAYGNSTTYTWDITYSSPWLTFKGMSAVNSNNSRGMLFNGSAFGGYSLGNADESSYYHIRVLPISDGTTYSAYSTTCAASHTVSSAVNPTGKATVTLGANSVAEGSTTTATYSDITAGYEFVNWTITGTGASLSSTTTNPTTITMGTANVTVTGNLQCITPSISVHPASRTDYIVGDVATALSVTANAGGASLSYQWQVSNNNSDWSDIAAGDGGTAATYTPSTAAATTKYYRVKVTNAATGCNTNFTSNAATITVSEPSGYCISLFNSSNNGIQSGFSNGGSGNEYTLDFTVPGKDGSNNWPQYWIGENNTWASFSGNATLADMPFVSATSATLGLAEGATGKLHIWDDNNAYTNLSVKFEPDGYGLRWGGAGEWDQAANTKAFTVDPNNANTYWTDMVTLDGTNNTTWNYFVGLQSASGYGESGVDNEASDSRGLSRTRSVTTMKVSNGTAGSYKATYLDSEATGSKGKFRIWDNNISDYNFVCHWVPFYEASYDVNGGGSISPAAVNVGPVCCEGSASERQVTMPAAPSYAHHDFGGWKSSADNSITAAGGTVSLTQNTTFTAQWTNSNYNISATLTNINTVTSFPVAYTYTGAAANVTYTFTAASGYRLPDNVTVTGSTHTWDKTTGELTLTGTITGAVSISITGVQTHTVTWLSNGSDYVTPVTYDHGATLALPAGTPSAPSSCSEKEFIGWTSDPEITSETSTEPTLITAGGAVNTDATYRAVFADVSGGGSSTITLTNSQIQSGRDGSNNYSDSYDIEGWTGKYAVNLASSHYCLQIGRNTDSSKGAYNSHITTPTLPDGATITSITLTPYTGYNSWTTSSGRTFYLMNTNSLNYTAASNQSNDYGVGSCASDNAAVTINTTNSPSQCHIYADGTTYLNSISLSYTSTSYDNYITLCCSLKPVTGLNVSGVTANSVTLTWTAPSPATGIDHLELRNASTHAKIGSDIAVGTTTVTVSELVECTEYSYYIASVGAACETASATVNARPYSGSKTVNYIYHDGATDNSQFTTDCDNPTITLPAPTWALHTFLGWYDAATGGNKLGDSGATYTPATSPVTLHAQWTETEFLLTQTIDSHTTAGHAGTSIKSSDIASSDLTLTYSISDGSYALPKTVTVSGGGIATWELGTDYTWELSADKHSATLTILQGQTISANVTITIAEQARYTVTLDEHGSTTTQYYAADDNLFTWDDIADCGTKKFYGWTADGEWTTSADESGLPASCVRTKLTETINSTRTYYAIYADAVVPTNPGYEKVTSVENGTYIIATYPNSSTGYAYKQKNASNNYGDEASVTFTQDDNNNYTIITTDNKGLAGEFTIEMDPGNSEHFSLYSVVDGKYITATSLSGFVYGDSKVYQWELTAENGILNIQTAQFKNNNNNYVRGGFIDNHGSNRWATYNTGGSNPRGWLFKKQTTTYSNFTRTCALYDIAIDGGITGGTVTTSPTAGTDAAGAGQEVTVNVTPDACKYLSALSYNDGRDNYDIDITSAPYTFTMPAADITITATFGDRTVSSIAPATATHRAFLQNGTFTGEQITVTYSNGETEDLAWDASGLTFSGYNMSTLSTQTVHVVLTTSCGNASCDYSIDVLDGVPVTYVDAGEETTEEYDVDATVPVESRAGRFAATCDGWDFAGWSETPVADNSTAGFVAVRNFTATTPRRLYAVYVKREGTFTLINTPTALQSGVDYIFARLYSTEYYAPKGLAGTGGNANYLQSAAVTISDNQVTGADDLYVWTLQGEAGNWAICNLANGKYMDLSTDNHATISSTITDRFTITADAYSAEKFAVMSNTNAGENKYLSYHSSHFNGYTNSGEMRILRRTCYFSSNPPCAPRSVTFHGNGGTVTDGVNESSDLVITEANRGDGITTPTAAMAAADCNGNVWEFIGWLPEALARTQIPVLTTDLLNYGGGNKAHTITADNEEYYAVYSNTGMPETKSGTITFTTSDFSTGGFQDGTLNKTANGDNYEIEYHKVGCPSGINHGIQIGQLSDYNGYIQNVTSLGKINSISFNTFDISDISRIIVYVGETEDAVTTRLDNSTEMQTVGGISTFYPAGKYSYFKIQSNGYTGIESISVDFGKGSVVYASTPDCTLRVTYKAAGEEDHVVEIGEEDSHNLPAYYPAGCDDKEFIGWAEAGISALQQTAPTIATTDGSLTDVSAPKTLYAVYASRNGGKNLGTTSNIFNETWSTSSWDGTNQIISGAVSSWTTDVSTTPYFIFQISNNLYPSAMFDVKTQDHYLVSEDLLRDLKSIEITGSSRDGVTVYVEVWVSADNVSWTQVGNGQSLPSNKALTTRTYTLSEKGDYYVKVIVKEKSDTSGTTIKVGISGIRTIKANCTYYMTDYSTTCDKASAPVALTWAETDGSTIETGTEPETVSLGTWLTLPTLSKDNYRFDGWKVTLDDDQKADLYLGGETFLINHPVTFTAQWTKVFESVALPQHMPVVAANGVGVKSSVTGRVVINRADAAKPTAVLTGDNAALFSATVNNGVTKGETTVFTYSVTYTPSAANTSNEVQLAFRDGDGTGATTGVTSSSLTLSGRSLPEQFVITAQVNGVYLGLPENTTNSAQLMPYAVTDVADGTAFKTAFNVENTMKYHVTGSSDSVVYISSNTGDENNHKFAGFQSGLRSANSQNGAHYNWYITYNTSTGTYRLRNTGVIEDSQSFALTYNGQSNVQKFNMIKEETVNASFHRDLYLLPIMEETGYWLDIVDWNISSLTVNMNGRKLTNGVDAKVGEGEMQTLTPNTRYSWTGNSDRTYDVQIGAPAAGSYVRLHVEWGTKTGADVSERLYHMPYIYTGNTTLSDAGAITAADNIVVRSGRLTVDADVAVRNVYVYPGAELVIASNRKLKAEKMYLRTEPFRTAALDDRGTLDVGQLYYTRIVADKDHAFMFGLPYDSKIEDMRLTTGQTMAYGTKWRLYTYNAARRAENGASASGENWQAVSDTVTNIEAKKAYDLLSGSAYYREYCFPVNYVKREDGQTIEITDYTGTAATANPIHGGWNHFCSPYTRNYVQDFSGSPEEAVKLTELTEDRVTYWQHVPEVINPAIAYFYQTSANGTLTFGSSMLTFAGVSNIAARSHEQKVNTQWLVLNLTDKAGLTDETNFYLHPTKFNINYEIKYDLEKMLGYAARPQLFSMMSCGALSFNALPDSIAEEGVQLGYYAAAEGEYTFSLADNKYMDRLQEVWLVDGENGTLTDLRSADYTFTTTAGDNRTRFRLFVTFRREEPQTPTGDMQLQDGENNNNTRKFVYKNRLFILRDGRLYDVLGNGVRE